MTNRERRFLRRLPKPFELFRGYNKPRGKMGLSWSVDKKAAARIPFNPQIPGKQNPWVITAVASPEHVLAYLTERGEKEIVIHPKNILRIVREEPVPKFVPALERHTLQFATASAPSLRKHSRETLPLPTRGQFCRQRMVFTSTKHFCRTAWAEGNEGSIPFTRSIFTYQQ